MLVVVEDVELAAVVVVVQVVVLGTDATRSVLGLVIECV